MTALTDGNSPFMLVLRADVGNNRQGILYLVTRDTTSLRMQLVTFTIQEILSMKQILNVLVAIHSTFLVAIK